MPSIITHDCFGCDAYAKRKELIGEDPECRKAFLLGNQGPDPLLYAVVSPQYVPYMNLGSTMHKSKTAELVLAMRRSLEILSPADRPIGQAYALGFLCHWLLDSTAHPYVYSLQYAVCDAGEPGLSRKDGSEVHSAIESQIDESILLARAGKTIQEFAPQSEILQASEHTLNVISRMYSFCLLVVYGETVPSRFFAGTVKLFRKSQHLFYSPRGIKRAVLSRIERMFRRHSFYSSMSHHCISAVESWTLNRDHGEWVDPHTGAVRNESFKDLYDRAQERVEGTLDAFVTDGFSPEDAHALTGDINFAGQLIAEAE